MDCSQKELATTDRNKSMHASREGVSQQSGIAHSTASLQTFVKERDWSLDTDSRLFVV